jgi:hypothetical protein
MENQSKAEAILVIKPTSYFQLSSGLVRWSLTEVISENPNHSLERTQRSSKCLSFNVNYISGVLPIPSSTPKSPSHSTFPISSSALKSPSHSTSSISPIPSSAPKSPSHSTSSISPIPSSAPESPSYSVNCPEQELIQSEDSGPSENLNVETMEED